MKARPLFLIVIFLLLPVSWASAHRLNLFAYQEGNKILGEVYFSDGSPAKKVKVILQDEKGRNLLLTETDLKGRFTFPLPQDAKVIRLVSLGQMGHQAEITLKLKGEEKTVSSLSKKALPPKNPASETTTCSQEELARLIRKEIKRETEPLKELLLEILKETRKPGLEKILSGLGYIFGLFGLVFWIKSRR